MKTEVVVNGNPVKTADNIIFSCDGMGSEEFSLVKVPTHYFDAWLFYIDTDKPIHVNILPAHMFLFIIAGSDIDLVSPSLLALNKMHFSLLRIVEKSLALTVGAKAKASFALVTVNKKCLLRMMPADIVTRPFKECLDNKTETCIIDSQFAGLAAFHQLKRMLSLAGDYNIPPNLNDARIAAMLSESFSYRKTGALSWTDVEKLMIVRLTLDDRFSEKHSLHALARAAGLNISKLKTQFRLYFGCTVFEYLRDLRMTRAVELLGRGNHSVASVATELGFENVASFSTAFRRHFGCRPRDVKK